MRTILKIFFLALFLLPLAVFAFEFSLEDFIAALQAADFARIMQYVDDFVEYKNSDPISGPGGFYKTRMNKREVEAFFRRNHSALLKCEITEKDPVKNVFSIGVVRNNDGWTFTFARKGDKLVLIFIHYTVYKR